MRPRGAGDPRGLAAAVGCLRARRLVIYDNLTMQQHKSHSILRVPSRLVRCQKLCWKSGNILDAAIFDQHESFIHPRTRRLKAPPPVSPGQLQFHSVRLSKVHLPPSGNAAAKLLGAAFCPSFKWVSLTRNLPPLPPPSPLQPGVGSLVLGSNFTCGLRGFPN